MTWFLTPKRIAVGYMAVSAAWILLSDLAVDLLPLSVAARTEISITKGWGFVIVTGLLLLVLKTRLHQRYEDVVANAPLSIVVTDLEGNVVAWNPASEALWGWTSAEAVGGFVPWMDEADRSAFLQHLRAVSVGARPVHEAKARRRRDGAILELRTSYAAFQDASGRRLVAILSDDVTAQVAAQQALEHSLLRLEGLHELDRAILARSATREIADVALRHLMKLAPVARTSLVLFDHEAGQAEVLAAVHPEGFGPPVPMLTVDAAGQVMYANPAACRAFGADGELLGRSLADLVPAAMDDLHPDDLSHGLSPAAPEPAIHHEAVEASRLDGSPFPVSVSMAPLVGRSRPESVVALVDLTERIELERRLAHAERMETLGQFAGILAHDVRSYINAIGWSAEALTRGLPEDHELRADAGLIGEAVAEAREMIGSVLEFARPTPAGGSAQLARHMSRVGGIISRLLGPDVTVEVAVPDDLPPVALAPASLTQVLVNLASNAREAMPDGGVFRVQARPIDAGEADEAAGAPAGPHPARVRLEVSDTGAGMDAATSARVFEPFYTTRGDREGAEGGVGLGLASVHLAVVRAGGSVRVESAPGAGTRFVMDLPVAAQPA